MYHKAQVMLIKALHYACDRDLCTSQTFYLINEFFFCVDQYLLIGV